MRSGSNSAVVQRSRADSTLNPGFSGHEHCPQCVSFAEKPKHSCGCIASRWWSHGCGLLRLMSAAKTEPAFLALFRLAMLAVIANGTATNELNSRVIAFASCRFAARAASNASVLRAAVNVARFAARPSPRQIEFTGRSSHVRSPSGQAHQNGSMVFTKNVIGVGQR